MHTEEMHGKPASNMADELVKNKSVEEVETSQVSAKHSNVAAAQRMSAEEFLETEKGLKRKLDTRLMMPIVFIYILNYLDRLGCHGDDPRLLTATGITSPLPKLLVSKKACS